MSELRFVVQLHRARRLHYDFRLEVGGVLVSWAVPKGPTLDPKVRRAAFKVGDHPMEYVAFEGVIPAGTYGGGDVIVWDTGAWVPYKDPDPGAALDAGELHVELFGEKLRGRFVMVRTRRDEWLLLKKRDEHAVAGWEPGEHPLSVLSGRSSDEVKADPEWEWRSELPAERAALRLKAEDERTRKAEDERTRKAEDERTRKAEDERTRKAEHANDTEHANKTDHTNKTEHANKTGHTNEAEHTNKAERSNARARKSADKHATTRERMGEGARASVHERGGADAGAPGPEREHTRADERERAAESAIGGLESLRNEAGLDAIGENGTWEVYGRRLRVTNLGKVLFPGRGDEEAVTKRELLRYTARIAPTVVPYLAGRALNLHRFPNGSHAPGFWQKALPAHAPQWLTRWREPGSGTEYLVADEPAALVWAANYGGLEWHPWTSTVDHPDRPSYALVDLDPGDGTAWEDLLVLARLHRTAFEHLGVEAGAKVTGQRGIQIWVPISRGPGFAETRAWVEGLSRSIGAVVPDLVSWAWEKAERGGRARLDFTQNAVNKTLVAPYSPRPAPGAPVSAPITWDELDDPALRPDAFTIRTIGERLSTHGDLFSPVLHTQQSLPPLT
ncbi:DNA polymerase ligase N-terminal domain-containing protein [Dactylosporangium sp. CA-139114]|uniref:non-homologous end-joining DNA ligase LigD n=1 Tax=Dactylosporangium sp. CA-139114 TaxID=3239931 RepID=UPI003D9699D1